MASQRRAIYVISDSTGETGSKVVQAALLQFRHEEVRLRIFSSVRDEAALTETIDRAGDEEALVVYTLVKPEMRIALHDRAVRRGVEAVDLMGSLMARIGRWLGETPVATPGIRHRLDEKYFRRVEALEFAVKNDDGQLPRNLDQAEVVIVGVSRTSKTPVSSILAQKGYKVANLPLILGVEPPAEIAAVDPRRVFALTIAPRALYDIRRARVQHLGVEAQSGYADLAHIQRELAWARNVVRKHPDWVVIDVTSRAVEETASEILSHHTKDFGSRTI
ncbi:MAG: pyruvate, water dikinase regulatory protein [Planctomycetota bacterium]|jgi:regulator of PEP synthase PpsR (kinase-PPPase family)